MLFRMGLLTIILRNRVVLEAMMMGLRDGNLV